MATNRLHTWVIGPLVLAATVVGWAGILWYCIRGALKGGGSYFIVMSVFLLAIPLIIFFLSRADLRDKADRVWEAEHAYFGPSPTGKRFGFLKELKEPVRPPDWLLVLTILLGVAGGAFWAFARTGSGTYVVVGGLAALFFLLILYSFLSSTLRSNKESKKHPPGYCESKGLVWSITNGEVVHGEFELELKPGGGARNQILAMTATAGALRQSVQGVPDLEITIGRQAGFYQIVGLRLGGMAFLPPTAKEPTGKQLGIDIVAGDEVVNTRLDSESLWSMLRRIGAVVKAIPEVCLPVTLVLAAQRAGEGVPANQGSGVTPGMVGYAVGAALGVGAVGALVGAAAGGFDPIRPTPAQPTDVAHERAIRAFVYGNPEKPSTESLSRIAEEFGWKLQAPVSGSSGG